MVVLWGDYDHHDDVDVDVDVDVDLDVDLDLDLDLGVGVGVDVDVVVGGGVVVFTVGVVGVIPSEFTAKQARRATKIKPGPLIL